MDAEAQRTQILWGLHLCKLQHHEVEDMDTKTQRLHYVKHGAVGQQRLGGQDRR